MAETNKQYDIYKTNKKQRSRKYSNYTANKYLFYYLYRGGCVFTPVLLGCLTGLFVCQWDYAKSPKWIFTKLSGRRGLGPVRNK